MSIILKIADKELLLWTLFYLRYKVDHFVIGGFGTSLTSLQVALKISTLVALIITVHNPFGNLT